jgi:hypothetical protein
MARDQEPLGSVSRRSALRVSSKNRRVAAGPADGLGGEVGP